MGSSLGRSVTIKACAAALVLSLPVAGGVAWADGADGVADSGKAAAFAAETGGVLSGAELNELGIATASEAEPIVDWTAWGSCEWMIDGTGCLIVRPANGADEGYVSNGVPWSDYRSSIKAVRFDGTCHAANRYGFNCGGWFCDCRSLETIDLSGLDTSEVTGMGAMFAACASLVSVDGLAGLDTSSVTYMDSMFRGCTSLASVDGLSGWDTSSVTNMNAMFHGCAPLTSADSLASWDTSSVTDMGSMFDSCASLASVNGFAGWDISKVESAYYMFRNCTSLKTVDGLASWDVSAVTSASGMFYGCASLASVDGLADWDTSSVTDMGGMFCGCASLVSVDPLAGWNTTSVLNMGGYAPDYDSFNGMFSGCTSLASIDGIAGWDTSKVTKMSSMFDGCSSLRSIALGVAFAFEDTPYFDRCVLPSPSGDGLTGKWVSSADGKAYAPSEVPSNVAATYTAEGAAAIAASMFQVDVSNATYTGEAVTGRVTSKELTDGVDYETVYSGNVNAGTAKITVVGKGSYAGTLGYSFKINKAVPQYTAPTGVSASPNQTLGEVALPAGFSWQDAATTSVGATGEHTFLATFTPADTANYEVVRDVPVKVAVAAKAIDASMFAVDTSDATYSGKTVTGRVASKELVEGSDYEVTYSDNVNAGTAKVAIAGKGNYTGTLSYTFKINKAVPAYTAPTGLAATYGQMLGDVALPSGFSWQDAATASVGNAGEHTFLATFTFADTANYEVVRDVPVKVAVAAKAIDASMFTVDTSDAAYTGSAITGRVSSKELAEGADYEVAYSDNVNAGTAKVVITGKGNYAGTLEYSFKIVAPAPAPTPEPTPTPDPTPDLVQTFPDVDYSQWYADGVTFCSEMGLITGYATGEDAGKFGVGRTLTRAQLAAILWRNAEPDAAEAYNGDAANETGMADVADNEWYTGAANWAVRSKVINGVNKGDHREFCPNDPVTAEQLAAILANYADPAGAESADLGVLDGFADSGAISDWARGSVAWAKSKQIINGYDEGGVRLLKPYEEIARERVATILMNAFEGGVLK